MVKSSSGRARYFVAKLYLGKELFMGYGWTEEHARTSALKRVKKAKGHKVTLDSFDKIDVSDHVGPAPRGLGGWPKRTKA